MQSAPQMPNLAAGFRNNIGPMNGGPVQMQMPQQNIVPANLQQQLVHTPQFQQPNGLQGMPQQMVAGGDVGGDVVDTISVFGQVFQRRYFYLFLIVLLGLVGYFVWKWYSGKKKNGGDDDSDDDDSDDSDENDFDIDQQMDMNQMNNMNNMNNGMPNNQQLMKQLLQQQMMAQKMKQQNEENNEGE